VPVARIYVRVSTDAQTTSNQLEECRALAASQGFITEGLAVFLYEETESAAKSRPVLDTLKHQVRAGDLVIVWALDRLGRSMQGVINDVLAFDARGVRVVSVREPWLDTRGPVRELLLAVFGWVAQQERERLVERTKAGLERARREGKHIGRPRASPVMLHAAAEAVQGRRLSIRKAARRYEVSEATLRRFLMRLNPPQAATSPVDVEPGT